MTELSSQTRDVLRLARSAKVLPDERRSAHKRALYARLGLSAALVTSKAAGATGATWFTSVGPLKIIILAAVLAGTGAVGYRTLNSEAPRERPAALSQKSVQHESPPVPVVQAPIAPVATVEPTVEKPAAKRAAAPRSQVSQVDDGLLLEETRLIRAADRALRNGDATGAIKLLDEHTARFKKGILTPERSALRLLASCVQGSASKAQASAYIRKNQSSALAARLKQACLGEQPSKP